MSKLSFFVLSAASLFVASHAVPVMTPLAVADDSTAARAKTLRPADLPEAVTKAIKAKYSGGKLLSARYFKDGDKLTFLVLVSDGDNDYNVTVTQDGKITQADHARDD